MNSSNYFITLVAILKTPAPTPMRQSLKLSDAVEIREIDRTHGSIFQSRYEPEAGLS